MTDPALLVELRLRRAGEEETLQPAPSLLSGLSVESRPWTSASQSPARVREEAAVHAAGHDDPVLEDLPETWPAA